MTKSGLKNDNYFNKLRLIRREDKPNVVLTVIFSSSHAFDITINSTIGNNVERVPAKVYSSESICNYFDKGSSALKINIHLWSIYSN